MRGDIFVNLYPDRLEIHSPGLLPLGITPSNILTKSVQRNHLLAKLLYDLKLMEKEGSGYDIITELENKKISNWTEVKKGSIYHALKTLQADEAIIEVSKMKTGLYPEKTIFRITNHGKVTFDKYQAEAFLGLYPNNFSFSKNDA